MHTLYKGMVHPWLCDVMGHMNVRHYVGMFDDAGYQLLAEATGWNSVSEEWKGKGWADVNHQIEYLAELQSGTLIEIEGGITHIGSRSFTAHYNMKSKLSGEKAARMTAKVVYFDLVARCSLPITDLMKTKMEVRCI